MRQFFGKYRGKVTSNVDPQGRGRAQVSVPAVMGEGRLSWAEQCAPYGFYAVPDVGTSVWVEFEAGDPDYPILAGTFLDIGGAPAPPGPLVKVWKTGAVTMTLSDVPGKGGLKIEVGAPAVAVPMTLSMSATGIELSIGKSSVKLSAAQVSINEPALVVM